MLEELSERSKGAVTFLVSRRMSRGRVGRFREWRKGPDIMHQIECQLDILKIVGIQNGVDVFGLDVRLGLEVRSDDCRGNAKVLNENASIAQKKISNALDDVLPIFVACNIVVPNVKIHERKQ